MMRFHYTVLYVLISSIILLPHLHADKRTTNEPVGMVTSLRGEASTERGEKLFPLTLGLELLSGDQITVVKGTLGIVYYQGDFIELKEGEVFQLGVSIATSVFRSQNPTRGVPENESVVVADNGFTRSVHKDRLSQLEYISGIRGDNTIVSLSPRLAIAEPLSPFYWFDGDTTASERSHTYIFLLKNEKGNVVQRVEFEANSGCLNAFQLSNAKTSIRMIPLEHYFWAVFRSGMESADEGAFASFVVTDSASLRYAEKTRSELSSLFESGKLDEMSFHMILSMQYLDERERLFADALPHLLWLAEHFGASEFTSEHIANVLKRFGNQVAPVAQYLARKFEIQK